MLQMPGNRHVAHEHAATHTVQYTETHMQCWNLSRVCDKTMPNHYYSSCTTFSGACLPHHIARTQAPHALSLTPCHMICTQPHEHSSASGTVAQLTLLAQHSNATAVAETHLCHGMKERRPLHAMTESIYRLSAAQLFQTSSFCRSARPSFSR